METPDKKQIIDDWALYTTVAWLKNLRKLRIGQTGELLKSMDYQVISGDDGDVQKIKFTYLYYGMFVDMGVGKGTKLGGVKENTTSRRLEGKKGGHGGNRRMAKKWYSKTAYREVLRLGEIMQEKYGQWAEASIVEHLQTEIKL